MSPKSALPRTSFSSLHETAGRVRNFARRKQRLGMEAIGCRRMQRLRADASRPNASTGPVGTNENSPNATLNPIGTNESMPNGPLGPVGTNENSPALRAPGSSENRATRPGGTIESWLKHTPAKRIPRLPIPTKKDWGFLRCGKLGPQPRISPVIVTDTTCSVSLLTGTIGGSNFAISQA